MQLGRFTIPCLGSVHVHNSCKRIDMFVLATSATLLLIGKVAIVGDLGCKTDDANLSENCNFEFKNTL